MIIVSEKELSAGSKSVEAASEFVEDAERPLDVSNYVHFFRCQLNVSY